MLKDQLPDANALFRCKVETITWLHIEGLVELVEIADDLVATELIRGVWVGCEASAHLFRTALSAPDLGPAEEESLVASKAIDYWGFASSE